MNSQTVQIFLILLIIIATYIAAYKFLKLSNALAMLAAASVAAIVSGFGVFETLRHIVEGSFTFLNIVLIIFTATTFIHVQKESGGLDALVRDLIIYFHSKPKVLLVLLMFLIMLPPAFTGPGADGIFAFGALVAPILLRMGIPLVKITAFIAFGGTLGVFAPPVNIPAMIIGSGVNMPYVGFFFPLAMTTIPLGIFAALILGAKYIKGPMHAEAVLKTLPAVPEKMKGIRIYLPLITVIALMISARAFPHFFPHLGTPLIFVIGIGVALFCGGKMNFLTVSGRAFEDTLSINAILLAVGSLVQIMSLTGVKGLFVITAITVPSMLLYATVFIGFPLFAGVLSSFGAASVFGIPFMLALLGRDPIIATVGLTLIATVGNLVPPTAILGKPAAIVAEYKESYMNVVKVSVLPCLVMNVVGISMIIFADTLNFLRF